MLCYVYWSKLNVCMYVISVRSALKAFWHR